jgi:hypothetical protein
MSVYLLVFMGSQAAGSFLWGVIANWVGAGNALVIAAGCLVLVAASVVVLPLRPQTGQLDRTVTAYCAPEPTLIFDPQPDDGPVVITIDYNVPDDNRDSFMGLMSGLEKSRRRVGAHSWSFQRSGETQDQYREEFTVPSWDEYTRGRTERWTGSDSAALARAISLTSEEPKESHHFPVRVGTLRKTSRA